jgi:hypothetical protein
MSVQHLTLKYGFLVHHVTSCSGHNRIKYAYEGFHLEGHPTGFPTTVLLSFLWYTIDSTEPHT